MLHSQTPPVIHRDLRPEHIILLPDGNVGLIGFGAACRSEAGQAADPRRLSARPTAAPEQSGPGRADRRADLYALGMSLIWLMTGRYDRDALTRANGVSPDLRRVLERAAARSPEDRYPDAAALSAALAGQAPRRSLRRWAILAAAAVLLSAAAIAVGILWPQPGARPETEDWVQAAAALAEPGRAGTTDGGLPLPPEDGGPERAADSGPALPDADRGV